MARGRRHTRSRDTFIILLTVVAGLCAGYFLFVADDAPEAQQADTQAPAVEPGVADAGPVLASGDMQGMTERDGDIPDPPPAGATPEMISNAKRLFEQGLADLTAGSLVAARANLNKAFTLGLPELDQIELQAELVRLADRMVFSKSRVKNDPFVDMYIIKKGETLGKIARANSVTLDLLAKINNMESPNMIRAGQRIKVVKGPFHAVIDKKNLDMYVYLGDTFVKHFKVGLGADNGTPAGEWKVKTKLTNPTYYPPRGGQIIAADDSDNPLGEHWIGLEGVSGEALGQERYGIHGTIDPESIGQSQSLGCIRMYNEDVDFLYDLLVVNKSRVRVQE